MRPLSFSLGIVLGTAVAITFVLVVVDLIYFLLGAEYPSLRADYGALGASTGLFLVLTTAAGLSFYAEVKSQRWWPMPAVFSLAWLVWIGFYFWPDPP